MLLVAVLSSSSSFKLKMLNGKQLKAMQPEKKTATAT
jgi:hypothetical protein